MAIRKAIEDLSLVNPNPASGGDQRPTGHNWHYTEEHLAAFRRGGVDMMLGEHGRLLGKAVPWMELPSDFIAASPRGGFSAAAWKWLARVTGNIEVAPVAAFNRGRPRFGVRQKGSECFSHMLCAHREHRAMVAAEGFNASKDRRVFGPRRGSGVGGRRAAAGGGAAAAAQAPTGPSEAEGGDGHAAGVAGAAAAPVARRPVAGRKQSYCRQCGSGVGKAEYEKKRKKAQLEASPEKEATAGGRGAEWASQC